MLICKTQMEVKQQNSANTRNNQPEIKSIDQNLQNHVIDKLTRKRKIEQNDTEIQTLRKNLENTKKQQKELIQMIEDVTKYTECIDFSILEHQSNFYLDFKLPTIEWRKKDGNKDDECSISDGITVKISKELKDLIKAEPDYKIISERPIFCFENCIYLRKKDDQVYLCVWFGVKGLMVKFCSINKLNLKLISLIGYM